MHLFSLIAACLANVMIQSGSTQGATLPFCYAKRLPLEGILISCDLHQTNIPLYCNFSAIENGKRSNECFGITTYQRADSVRREMCKNIFFPERHGTYRFAVFINEVNYRVETNDVIYERSELHLHKKCPNGPLVTCVGRWFLEVPFIKMFLGEREVWEIKIRSEKLPGSNDTILLEAAAEIRELDAGPLKVRCEAVYFVQNFTRRIAKEDILQGNDIDDILFLSKEGKHLPDMIMFTPGVNYEMQCSVQGPPVNLTLYCPQLNLTLHNVDMKSPIPFNISGSANVHNIFCVCSHDRRSACGVNEKNITFALAAKENSLETRAGKVVPIIKDSYGLMVLKRYEINEGDSATFKCYIDINEITTHYITVTCWNQNGDVNLNISHEAISVTFELHGGYYFSKSYCICQAFSSSYRWSQMSFFTLSVKGNSSSLSAVNANFPPTEAPGKDNVLTFYIIGGALIALFLPAVGVAIYNIYYYWKDHSIYGSNRNSASPQQSNEYDSIKNSPQSSKSESIPQENCALLESSNSYQSSGNSEGSGSGGSGQYYSPDDVDSRSSPSSVSIQTH